MINGDDLIFLYTIVDKTAGNGSYNSFLAWLVGTVVPFRSILFFSPRIFVFCNPFS